MSMRKKKQPSKTTRATATRPWRPPAWQAQSLLLAHPDDRFDEHLALHPSRPHAHRPLGHLTRPYIVYRSRDTALGTRTPRRGWERTG
ncbi:hypothetical protein GCM10027162_57760 [Streptomyces incanus]